MKTYGLIGFPLSHSFSKKFFTEKFETEQIFDCKYELFPIEKANQFSALIATQPSLCGLNVTIPHKVNIMPFLHQIDAAAAAIGAVNCIAISHKNGNKTLKGYNTDAYGFAQSLTPLLQAHHNKALGQQKR
jgi:shikimate dehydrogenase